MTSEIHARARDAFALYAGGINKALAPDRTVITGGDLTLADICFVAELSLFHNEKARVRNLEPLGLTPILQGWDAAYPIAFAHFERLRKHPAFAPDVQPYLKKFDVPQPDPQW